MRGERGRGWERERMRERRGEVCAFLCLVFLTYCSFIFHVNAYECNLICMYAVLCFAVVPFSGTLFSYRVVLVTTLPME